VHMNRFEPALILLFPRLPSLACLLVSHSSPLIVTFQQVPKSQWEWLITAAIFTFFPALAFVLMELFRNVTADGRSIKPHVENIAEGIVLVTLCVAWIPTVIVATTPGGAASLAGNAYFFTWLLVVFLFEGIYVYECDGESRLDLCFLDLVVSLLALASIRLRFPCFSLHPGLMWWIHDYRLEIHHELKRKAIEYKKRQREVLEQTLQLHQERLAELRGADDDGHDDSSCVDSDSASNH
jgi:hypothetical protein